MESDRHMMFVELNLAGVSCHLHVPSRSTMKGFAANQMGGRRAREQRLEHLTDLSSSTNTGPDRQIQIGCSVASGNVNRRGTPTVRRPKKDAGTTTELDACRSCDLVGSRPLTKTCRAWVSLSCWSLGLEGLSMLQKPIIFVN